MNMMPPNHALQRVMTDLCRPMAGVKAMSAA